MLTTHLSLVIWAANLYLLIHVPPTCAILDRTYVLVKVPRKVHAGWHVSPQQILDYSSQNGARGNFKLLSTLRSFQKGSKVYSYEESLKPGAVPVKYVPAELARKITEDIDCIKRAFRSLDALEFKVHPWFNKRYSELESIPQTYRLSELETQAHQRLMLIFKDFLPFFGRHNLRLRRSSHLETLPDQKTIDMLFQKEGNLILLELKDIFLALDIYATSSKLLPVSAFSLQRLILDVLGATFESGLIDKKTNIRFLKAEPFDDSFQRFFSRYEPSATFNAETFFRSDGMEELSSSFTRFPSNNLLIKGTQFKTWSDMQCSYLRDYLKSYKALLQEIPGKGQSEFVLTQLEHLLATASSQDSELEPHAVRMAWGQKIGRMQDDWVYHLFIYHLYHILRLEKAQFSDEFENKIEIFRKHLELFEKAVNYQKNRITYAEAHSLGFQLQLYNEPFITMRAQMIDLGPARRWASIEDHLGANKGANIGLEICSSIINDLNKQPNETSITARPNLIRQVRKTLRRQLEELKEKLAALEAFLKLWYKRNPSIIVPSFLVDFRKEIYKLINT